MPKVAIGVAMISFVFAACTPPPIERTDGADIEQQKEGASPAGSGEATGGGNPTPKTVPPPGGEGNPDAGAPSGETCIAEPNAQLADQDLSDTEEQWPKTPGKRIVVFFAPEDLKAPYAELLPAAALLWSPSPCIEARVVESCPASSHCVKVRLRLEDEDDPEDTDGDFTGKGEPRTSGTITLFTRLLDDESANGRLATLVHEMGHALGLRHRLNKSDVMNEETDSDTNPVPDATDFANLKVLYGTRTRTRTRTRKP